jgi:glycosyltransferase involved in cell wall biosynthesis
VINAFARRSLSTDPRMLGDLTVSMLEGSRGVLRKEFEKLIDWIAEEPLPDVINLPNSLLIGLARPLREAFGRPICCTLQGEDLFLEGLIEPYRQRAIDLIRKQVTEIDRFISVSEYYAPVMARLLRIPADRISVVPLGINLNGYEPAKPEPGVFRIGYLARVAPEKGLHVLAEAYCRFRDRVRSASTRLEAAGYLAPAHVRYLEGVRRHLEQAGFVHEFVYHGAVDRVRKMAFLRTLNVLSVPTPYDEPKGVFLLEAMASGVPVVQPRRGAFPEIVEKTGGGLLVEPDDPGAIARGLHELWSDEARVDSHRRRALEGVRRHYSIGRSADTLLAEYEAVLARGSRASDGRALAARR